MSEAPETKTKKVAKLKAKITAKAASDFHKDAPPRSKLWDTLLPGFHLVRMKAASSWRVIYRNSAGKERSITLGRYPSLTADVARKMAHDALTDVHHGNDPLERREAAREEAQHREQQTLGAYLEGAYALHQRRRKTGGDTLARIRLYFSTWLLRTMDSFRRADVERWQAGMEDKGLSYTTAKRNYDALQPLLNHAASRGVIAVNPLKGVRLERPAMTEKDLAEASNSRRFLDDEEVIALFAGLDAYQQQKRSERRNSRAHGKPYLPDLDSLTYADHVVPLVTLMFYIGFRPGDLMGLRWEHVNLPFATIRKVIEKTAHRRPEPQTFPICHEAVAILKAWHEQQGRPATGYVFTSPITKARLSKTATQAPWRTIKRHTRELASQGKIPRPLPDDLDLYTLRHNFASQLIMKGADLLTVSKLMGHADIQTTVAFYAHLAPNHTRDVVNAYGSHYQQMIHPADHGEGPFTNQGEAWRQQMTSIQADQGEAEQLPRMRSKQP